MAQTLDVKRLIATGRQLTEAGRSQAVQLRDGLVEQGRETTDQISAVIDKLVNPVGRTRDEDVYENMRTELSEVVREVVRDEVQRQLGALDLVTKEDLAALGQALLEDLRELERRLARPLQVTPPHQRAPVDPTNQ